MATRNTKNNANMGKTKRSTDEMIEQAIAQQNSWMENRRNFARRFLKSLNIFARPAPRKDDGAVVPADTGADKNARRGLRAYWFPILCALIVLFIAVWVAFFHSVSRHNVIVIPAVPDAVVRPVADNSAPSFDIVRIDPNGTIVVAGRWVADENVSVLINGKIVATEHTDARGEFVYAPTRPLRPGNYTLSLLGVEKKARSADKVFVYISERGYKNSLSLLMTKDGSTILQAPSELGDEDLVVSKIDYLDTGRIVVTGDALPRLRVSLSLNDEYIGFARVSDHRHFGLGADVGELQPGQKYNLAVRLHDGDGRTVATIEHNFVMPKMTGDSDTFYTVRRGDCLWIIARNFLRRGILFSIIADRNNITTPDLIYPKQRLQIPTHGGK